MSRDNVEIVRQAYAAANRGDVEALVSLAQPDVVSDLVAGEVVGRGKAGDVETRAPSAVIYWLREGRAARIEELGTAERALSAVGPAE